VILSIFLLSSSRRYSRSSSFRHVHHPTHCTQHSVESWIQIASDPDCGLYGHNLILDQIIVVHRHLYFTLPLSELHRNSIRQLGVANRPGMARTVPELTLSVPGGAAFVPELRIVHIHH